MPGSTEISLLNFTQFRDTTERMFVMGPDQTLVNELDDLKSLYMVESVPRGTGDRRPYTEIDGETYARYKAEGSDAYKTKVVTGYEKTMIARRFAAEITITYEARNYGKNQEILRKLTALGNFCPQRLALDLTHRFTFATSTSYTDMDGETVDTTVGDGLAAVAGAHTLTGSTATYSNVITGNPAFSQGAFETAMSQANTQIVTNFNERRVMNFNTIVTGDDPATVRAVRQFLGSMSDGTQTNSGVINTYRGVMRHVVLPRLATTATGAYDATKAANWGLVAAGEWEGHLGIWEEARLVSPEAGNNGENIHNDNWTFGARCGNGICVVSGKGLLWSTA